MAITFLRRVIAIVIIVVAAGLIPESARASERSDMTDLFIFGQYASDDETTASAFGSDFDITYDDSFGIGVGIGHNINDYVNINATLLVGEASVDVGSGFFAVSDDATLVAPDVNVDWNILDTDLTPFLTAGTGLMMFFGDTDETDFSYGVGGGLRWDISHDVFMKAWYRARWFELDETEDSLMLHTFNVGIGIMR